MSEPNANSALGRPLAIAASIVVLATIVTSLWVNGSPSAQREARLDERRIRDLDNIMDVIRAHSRETGALPANLGVLAGKPGISLAIVDPISGASASIGRPRR